MEVEDGPVMGGREAVLGALAAARVPGPARVRFTDVSVRLQGDSRTADVTATAEIEQAGSPQRRAVGRRPRSGHDLGPAGGQLGTSTRAAGEATEVGRAGTAGSPPRRGASHPASCNRASSPLPKSRCPVSVCCGSGSPPQSWPSRRAPRVRPPRTRPGRGPSRVPSARRTAPRCRACGCARSARLDVPPATKPAPSASTTCGRARTSSRSSRRRASPSPAATSRCARGSTVPSRSPSLRSRRWCSRSR